MAGKIFCEACKKPFRRKQDLLNHVKMKHEAVHSSYILKREFVEFSQKILCEKTECGDVFSSVEKYERHFLSKHGKSHLKPTVKILEPEKIPANNGHVICLRCGMNFLTVKALKRHSKDCTRTVYFNCKLCEGEFFASYEDLIKHTRKIHEKKLGSFHQVNNLSGAQKQSHIVGNYTKPMTSVSLLEDAFSRENRQEIAGKII